MSLVPYDDPMPGGTAARTGESVILPNREAGLAFHSGMAEVYDAIQRVPPEKRKLVTGAEGARVIALGGVPGKAYEVQEFTKPQPPG